MEPEDKAPDAPVEEKKAKRVMGRKSRLTPESIAKMQYEYEAGKPVREIARRYGIKVGTIYHYASKLTWGKHASKREEIVEIAREKVREEVIKGYAEVVKEVNDRHLLAFRKAADVAQTLMADLWERLKWARQKTAYQNAEWERDGRKGVPPQPVNTGKEVYALNQIVLTLKAALIEGERFILGLKDGAIEKDDPTSGAREITRILKEARQAYGTEMPGRVDLDDMLSTSEVA